jgi:hypothetical protein
VRGKDARQEQHLEEKPASVSEPREDRTNASPKLVRKIRTQLIPRCETHVRKSRQSQLARTKWLRFKFRDWDASHVHSTK